MRIVLDPGHGGEHAAGKSTPYGARGPSGALERDVVLRLSQLVAAELGGSATLTRYGNGENPSLAARAELARRAGAHVFVSLHAGDRRGAETWVHEQAGPRSSSLAGHIQRALGGNMRQGALGVLEPNRHARGTAACLVEVDALRDAYGGGALDTQARAIAQGIRAYGQYENWFNDPADNAAMDRMLRDPRGEDTRRVSQPAPAHAVVTELRTWSGTSPWRSLDKNEVCRRLDQLIDHPTLVQQGPTPLCGPASFFTCWIKRDPVAFARFAKTLFQTGASQIGSSYQVRPGQSLLAQNYGAAARGRSTFPPQADWMVMGAIRNAEDEIFIWDGVLRSSGIENDLRGLTFPEEIARWFTATGIYSRVDNRIGTGLTTLTSKGYNAAHDIEQRAGRDVVCLIQSNGFPALRMNTTPWPLSMFSNHFVVLNGSVMVIHERAPDPNSPLQVGVRNPRPWGSVTFPIWSFGQNYPDLISPTQEAFASSFFGGIVADLRD